MKTFFLGNATISGRKGEKLREIERKDFFLEITGFPEQKLHYQGLILSDDLFFLEITVFLGQKVHYPGAISSHDVFFRDHLESRDENWS